MRTRTHEWFNLKDAQPLYSFQVLINGKWHNVAEGGKPLWYATTAERDAKQAEYQRMKGDDALRRITAKALNPEGRSDG
jgi:hypothetical protein